MLFNGDQTCFIIDANLNEARTFLISIIEDSSSSAKAIELASKIILLLGLARSNIEDYLIAAKLLEIEPCIDLRAEFEEFKIDDNN